MSEHKSSDETLIAAMEILARDIQSGDGVANAAIREAGERIAELSQQRDELLQKVKQLEDEIIPLREFARKIGD